MELELLPHGCTPPPTSQVCPDSWNMCGKDAKKKSLVGINSRKTITWSSKPVSWAWWTTVLKMWMLLQRSYRFKNMVTSHKFSTLQHKNISSVTRSVPTVKHAVAAISPSVPELRRWIMARILSLKNITKGKVTIIYYLTMPGLRNKIEVESFLSHFPEKSYTEAHGGWIVESRSRRYKAVILSGCMAVTMSVSFATC